MDKYINKFEKMLHLRNLAKGTFSAYSSYLRCYLDYLVDYLDKLPEDTTWDELRDYIFYLRDTKEIKPRTINGHISQLKFFYLYVLNKDWNSFQIPYQKFDTSVPDVLTQHEAMEFINKIKNLKQKAVITLMYSSGLRVSEACNLMYDDISREKMSITIRESKNRSGSVAILSHKALDILTQYWMAFDKPKEWLFPGQHKGTCISTETARKYIKNQVEYLGWDKDITSHCFRRAFGTHLYQNKVDILTIKHLMRHKSISSTAAYIYLATIGIDGPISPFDVFDGLKK
jgi:site-specific recombinase XerD